MRRKAKTTHPIRVLFKKGKCASDDLFGVKTAADIDQLIKPPRANWRRRHAQHEFWKGLNIEDACGSPATQLGKTIRNGLQVIVVREGAFEIINSPHPIRETAVLENGASHYGEVEMAVGIDQTGHKDRVSQVFHLSRGELRCAPHSNYSASLDVDDTIFNGWRSQR